MKSLIYVIEAGDACDVPFLRDAITRDVYGSTLLEKNLRLLKKDFSTVRVILWIRPALRDEIERELKTSWPPESSACRSTPISKTPPARCHVLGSRPESPRLRTQSFSNEV
jgi:hypothetical protein